MSRRRNPPRFAREQESKRLGYQDRQSIESKLESLVFAKTRGEEISERDIGDLEKIINKLNQQKTLFKNDRYYLQSLEGLLKDAIDLLIGSQKNDIKPKVPRAAESFPDDSDCSESDVAAGSSRATASQGDGWSEKDMQEAMRRSLLGAKLRGADQGDSASSEQPVGKEYPTLAEAANLTKKYPSKAPVAPVVAGSKPAGPLTFAELLTPVAPGTKPSTKQPVGKGYPTLAEAAAEAANLTKKHPSKASVAPVVRSLLGAESGGADQGDSASSKPRLQEEYPSLHQALTVPKSLKEKRDTVCSGGAGLPIPKEPSTFAESVSSGSVAVHASSRILPKAAAASDAGFFGSAKKPPIASVLGEFSVQAEITVSLTQLPPGQFGDGYCSFKASGLSINGSSDLGDFALSLGPKDVLRNSSVRLFLTNGANNSKQLFVSIEGDGIVLARLCSRSRFAESTARLTYCGVDVEVSLSSANPGEAQQLKPPRS